MGFFDENLGGLIGGVVGGPLGFLVGNQAVDSPNAQRRKADELSDQQSYQRQRALDAQSAALRNMKAPELTPQALARIGALEQESQYRPLAEDPYFQGQRSELVNSGRAAMSDVQNRQKSAGVTGGFANVGSQQNIVDRLGVALANLGAQATSVREQKADKAAQMRQSIADSQRQFQNQIEQANAALIAGDANSASQAIQNAYNLQNQIDQQQRAFIGSLVGTAGSIGGAVVGGPAGASAGSSLGSGFNQQAVQSQSNYGYQPQQQSFSLFDQPMQYESSISNKPYYQMR